LKGERPQARQQAPVTIGRLILHASGRDGAGLALPAGLADLHGAASISDTITHGYVSLPSRLSLDNFTNVWIQADMLHFFLQHDGHRRARGVVLTLLWRRWWRSPSPSSLAPSTSCADDLHRRNLLRPRSSSFRSTGSTSHPGADRPHRRGFELFSDNLSSTTDHRVILIHVIFQTGFATFVLSNYRRHTKEITESRWSTGHVLRNLVERDPASLPARVGRDGDAPLHLHLQRLLLGPGIDEVGDKRPITAALNNLHGAFFTNYNLLAAGALLAAIPPVVIFILLQKHFVRGLTLGSTKG